jgi:hypothetical protein
MLNLFSNPSRFGQVFGSSDAVTLVVAHGDSITYIGNETEPGTYSYPGWTATLATYLGSGYRVVKHAASGRTIQDGIDNFASEVGSTLLTSTSGNRIAILALLTNSLYAGVSEANCKSQITSWVALARAAGATRVLIATGLPRNQTPWTGTVDKATFDARMASIATWIRAGADGLSVEALDWLAEPALSDPNNTTVYAADKVHPVAPGFRYLGLIAYETITGINSSNGDTWNSRIAAAGASVSTARKLENVRLAQRFELLSIFSRVALGDFTTANSGGNTVLSDRAATGTMVGGSNTHASDGLQFASNGHLITPLIPSTDTWNGHGIHSPGTISNVTAFDCGAYNGSAPSVVLGLHLGATGRVDYGHSGTAIISPTSQTLAAYYQAIANSTTTQRYTRTRSSEHAAISTTGVTGATPGTSTLTNNFAIGCGRLNSTSELFSNRKYGYYVWIKNSLSTDQQLDLAVLSEAWYRRKTAVA